MQNNDKDSSIFRDMLELMSRNSLHINRHTVPVLGIILIVAVVAGFIGYQYYSPAGLFDSKLKTIEYMPSDFSAKRKTAKVYSNVNTAEECLAINGKPLLAGIGVYVGCEPS